nr:MAG TPA: hypothetical protein [Bacteriophage sp.]
MDTHYSLVSLAQIRQSTDVRIADILGNLENKESII